MDRIAPLSNEDSRIEQTLLEALEAIATFAGEAASGYGNDPDTDVAIIERMARNAIAKAKGAQS